MIRRVTYETRPVNLADCAKGAPACAEAGNCGGPACGDCTLPRRVVVTVSFTGFTASVVVDSLDGSPTAAYVAVSRSLCNGTTAVGAFVGVSVTCDPRTVDGHHGIQVLTNWVWDNGFTDVPEKRCGSNLTVTTVFDAPDFDPCARPFAVTVALVGVTESCGIPFGTPAPCLVADTVTVTVTEWVP